MRRTFEWLGVRAQRLLRRWPRVLLILSCVILLLSGLFWLYGRNTVAALSDHDGGNAVPVDNTQVIDGGGFDILPGIIYRDSGPPLLLDDEQALIVQELLNLDHLRQWWLCSAELAARATRLTSDGNAWLEYPDDPPVNYDAADQAANRAYGMQLLQRAAVYRQAAALADQARLPCVAPGDLHDGHYVSITADYQGAVRKLLIPDYAVVIDPAEYLLLRHKCVRDLQAAMQRVQDMPIDTKVSIDGPLATFSTWAKASDLATYVADIQLAQVVNVPCA